MTDDGHRMYMDERGQITHTFEEGSEPTELVHVDHIVTGGTVGRMLVEGDVAILLEFQLLGEEETAVLAIDPVTALIVAEGMLVALTRTEPT